MVKHRRVPSYNSLSQLADWSRENSINALRPGLYSLHVTLYKATDLPGVSSSKMVSVQFALGVGNKRETSSSEFCLVGRAMVAVVWRCCRRPRHG